jgi:hypothetical protein
MALENEEHPNQQETYSSGEQLEITEREFVDRAPPEERSRNADYIQDAKKRRDTFYTCRKKMKEKLWQIGQQTNCYGFLYLRR